MNRTSISIAIAVASLSMSAVPGLASEAASKSFITKAIEGNLAEINLGKLAQEKAQSDSVKEYGKMLEADHRQANDKAVQAANSLGVTPPTSPTSKAQSEYKKMDHESGAQFERDFINYMVMDHKKDISDYRREARQGNDAVSQYANDSLPTLEKHLRNAQAWTNKQARK